MVGGRKIFADQPFGRRCFLDFGNQAIAARVDLAAQSGGKAAHRPGIDGIEIGERALRTARGDFAGLGFEDLGELVHLYAIQQLSSALASPFSMASAASSTPSASVLTAPATMSASAAL